MQRTLHSTARHPIELGESNHHQARSILLRETASAPRDAQIANQFRIDSGIAWRSNHASIANQEILLQREYRLASARCARRQPQHRFQSLQRIAADYVRWPNAHLQIGRASCRERLEI